MQSEQFPRVSVVLPVYNGEQWIEGAIRCVLDQHFTDFELIVIDDGSKDNSWALISAISDARIRAYRQNNKGLAATLNFGINRARGALIARQDQDDWMHPERLARQVDFMMQYPDCAAVGTWAEIREDDVSSDRRHEHPLSNAALRMSLMFDNPFVHSSMMLRREAVLAVGGYCEDRNLQPPEDYELWSRLAARFEVANIGEVLTAYREVAGSMSRTGVSPFQGNVLRISAQNLARVLHPQFTLEECRALSSLYHGLPRKSAEPFLSRKKAIAMTHNAAIAIAGEPSMWSKEVTHVYVCLSGHVSAQSLRRYFPRPLLNFVRALRGILRG